MAENMARAMIFVSLLAASVLVGFLNYLYAAHCFLTTVQQTAAGNDRIRWPNEPLYDKLPRAGYLACLLGIWIAPAGLLLRLNPNSSIDGSPLLTFLVTATLLIWGLFPVGLFSALSGSSPWMLFRVTVLQCFLSRFGATIFYYMVTAVLIGGSFGLLYLAFTTGSILFTFTVPPIVAAAFLIHARLLGRMAYLFDQLPRGSRRPKSRARTENRTETRKKKKKPKGAVEDPWAVPEESPKPKKAKRKVDEIDGYALADTEESTPVKEAKPARRVKAYRLADEPPPNPPVEIPADGYIPVGYETIPASGSSASSAGATGTDFDQRFREKPVDEDPPPANPLFSGVYSFPWYAGNIPAWLLLTFGGVALCGLIQLMLMFKPPTGE
jgi:hypothetical protein